MLQFCSTTIISLFIKLIKKVLTLLLNYSKYWCKLLKSLILLIGSRAQWWKRLMHKVFILPALVMAWIFHREYWKSDCRFFIKHEELIPYLVKSREASLAEFRTCFFFWQLRTICKQKLGTHYVIVSGINTKQCHRIKYSHKKWETTVFHRGC